MIWHAVGITSAAQHTHQVVDEAVALLLLAGPAAATATAVDACAVVIAAAEAIHLHLATLAKLHTTIIKYQQETKHQALVVMQPFVTSPFIIEVSLVQRMLCQNGI